MLELQVSNQEGEVIGKGSAHRLRPSPEALRRVSRSP